MKPSQFKKLLSDIEEWIGQTLSAFKTQMQPVAAAQLDRLNQYYPKTVLQRIQRVIVDRCPVPPLAVTGIPQLAEIEKWDIKGIPWINTIFIRRDLADWDAVHFHEMLHIIQWEYLGTERYLTAWAIGTITRGYRDNPLEEMAFRHQLRFDTDKTPYDVISEVKGEMAEWPESYFEIGQLA
jgi:hypothetical protein